MGQKQHLKSIWTDCVQAEHACGSMRIHFIRWLIHVKDGIVSLQPCFCKCMLPALASAWLNALALSRFWLAVSAHVRLSCVNLRHMCTLKLLFTYVHNYSGFFCVQASISSSDAEESDPDQEDMLDELTPWATSQVLVAGVACRDEM